MNNPRNGIRALAAPMQMSSLVTPAADVSSIWLNGAKDDGLRNVDQKKLQKAEAKILQKKEQRDEKPKTMNILDMDCQATAAQVVEGSI